MIGVMVVSHEPLGTALIRCTRHVFGRLPPQLAALDVIPDEDPVAAGQAATNRAETEKMADRVAILLRGKLVATGTPRELTATGAGFTKVSISSEQSLLCADPIAFPAVHQRNVVQLQCKPVDEMLFEKLPNPVGDRRVLTARSLGNMHLDEQPIGTSVDVQFPLRSGSRHSIPPHSKRKNAAPPANVRLHPIRKKRPHNHPKGCSR